MIINKKSIFFATIISSIFTNYTMKNNNFIKTPQNQTLEEKKCFIIPMIGLVCVKNYPQIKRPHIKKPDSNQ